MKAFTQKTAIYVLIILAVLAAGAGFFELGGKALEKRDEAINRKIAGLQNQISSLKAQVAGISGRPLSEPALPAQEAQNREAIRQKSQDQLLTEAVAKVAPAVVSVVISKDVPQLEVTYVNPFGDDPFFQDFGYRVPVYTQKGTVKQKVGGGTGFLITSDGYILTNRHVVEDTSADYTVLLSSGKQAAAKVVYKDPKNDVAIIKIDGGGFAKADLGDSGGLKLGQTVIAIGNALAEYSNTVSTGIISGLNRTIQAADNTGASETLTGVIQTDAAINPGNSGGPLLDLDGQVMGINVATVQGSSNISFSIPVNQVKQILKTIIGRQF